LPATAANQILAIPTPLDIDVPHEIGWGGGMITRHFIV